MSKIMTFSKFVSDAGKADMIMNEYGYDALVKVTDIHGDSVKCYLNGTGSTPDDELLLTVTPKGAAMSEHFFMSDIASVEG
jgi:hypothetical protein